MEEKRKHKAQKSIGSGGTRVSFLEENRKVLGATVDIVINEA